MTKPNELLPCQVSDAMLDMRETVAGKLRARATIYRASGYGINYTDEDAAVDELAADVIYTAMTKASTIPTDGDDAALVEQLRAPKQWCCIFEHEGQMRHGTTDAPFRAADRLSTIPSAENGELREAARQVVRYYDAELETIAAGLVRELEAALSIQTTSGMTRESGPDPATRATPQARAGLGHSASIGGKE